MNLQKFYYINTTQNYDFEYIKKTKGKVIIHFEKKNNPSIYHKLVNLCLKSNIRFYIANEIKYLFKFKANGFYISAFNKKKYNYLRTSNKNIDIIGSAHNYKEIREKISQGCSKVILSRLFATKKKGNLGVTKFNLLAKDMKNIICLGGINNNTFKKIKLVKCCGFALKSDLPNKPSFLLK